MLSLPRLRAFVSNRRLPLALAMLGAFLYLLQAWYYARYQISLLDEGAYLLKGLLFATRQYRPFESNGPWSNHMPLSFLIPGYAQLLFGAGLRTGRYVMIFSGLLALVGLWVVTRRLGNSWWAALAVWGVVLNPAVIKHYSLANSQALVAAFLVWSLALILGGDRSLWQLLAGAALAGFLMMTRLNMAPLVGLAVLYIAWEYGWRTALLAALAGFAPVILLHAWYWPGILVVWARFVPVSLAPFLLPWAEPVGGLPSWNPPLSWDTRIMSLLHGIRFHFVVLFGALSAVLLWPGKQRWTEAWRFRTTVFLLALFTLLAVMHMVAALGLSYCVYCFPLYLSFFSLLGYLIIVVSFPVWLRYVSARRSALIAVGVLGLFLLIGYGASTSLGDRLLSLLYVQVPRVRLFAILPGTTNLGAYPQSLFNLSHLDLERYARRVIPTVAGLLFGGIWLLLVWGFARWFKRRSPERALPSFGATLLIASLGLGFVFSPSIVLSGGYDTYDCRQDVLRSYETIGAQLRDAISPGSTVFWRGGDSAVPLLYLPSAKLFPAQINGDYAYRLGGDPAELVAYGYWNEQAGREWIQQADYVLVSVENNDGWIQAQLTNGPFTQIMRTSRPAEGCQDDSPIYVYQRQR